MTLRRVLLLLAWTSLSCVCLRQRSSGSSDGVEASSAHARIAVEGDDPGWSPPPVSSAAPFPEASPAVGGDRAPRRLVAEAERELLAVRLSRYRHKTHVDETTGTFEFDCSGFVAHALRQADPAALLRVPPGPKGRPRAEDFVAFFAHLGADDPAWSTVARGGEVAPGDVIAWLRPAEIVSTNTGHMAIVLQRVGLGPVSSAVATIGGVRELLLRVADSTESPHEADTRSLDAATGLGTGVIGLIVDVDDAPIGYRWRGGKSPRAFATPIAIARLR